MALTKQEKVGLLARALERKGITRNQGETDAQFANRIVTEKVEDFKARFLKVTIKDQIDFEAEVLDVSDL